MGWNPVALRISIRYSTGWSCPCWSGTFSRSLVALMSSKRTWPSGPVSCGSRARVRCCGSGPSLSAISTPSRGRVPALSGPMPPPSAGGNDAKENLRTTKAFLADFFLAISGPPLVVFRWDVGCAPRRERPVPDRLLGQLPPAVGQGERHRPGARGDAVDGVLDGRDPGALLASAVGELAQLVDAAAAAQLIGEGGGHPPGPLGTDAEGVREPGRVARVVAGGHHLGGRVQGLLDPAGQGEAGRLDVLDQLARRLVLASRPVLDRVQPQRLGVVAEPVSGAPQAGDRGGHRPP